MKIRIEDLKMGLVNGVDIQMPCCAEVYKERYFTWESGEQIARFDVPEIKCGILKAYHHTPEFKEVETHDFDEMFLFLSGTAIMLFIDVIQGVPAAETAQVVRIQSGTQIIISKGKGHFVPVAESEEPIEIVVISPVMDAPRTNLSEQIVGI